MRLDCYCWTASWYVDGKIKTARFGETKWGAETAFQMACDCREAKKNIYTGLCHENDSIRVRTPVPRQYGMPKPTWLYMYTCDELDGLWDHAAITFGEGILWIHDENGVNTPDDFHNNLIKIKWKKQRKVQ